MKIQQISNTIYFKKIIIRIGSITDVFLGIILWGQSHLQDLQETISVAVTS